MVDPGEGLEGPEPPLFLDQTEAQRAEKFFFETAPPNYLKVWTATELYRYRYWKKKSNQ